MAYDYEAAKAAGLSDADIGRYLAGKYGYRYDQARGAGVPDSDIVAHLIGKDLATSATAGPLGPDVPGSSTLEQAGHAFRFAASPLLWAIERLNQAGSQAAGGVVHAARTGQPMQIPVEYGRGLLSGLTGRADEPQVLAELQAAGFNQSPVPAALEALPMGYGTAAKVARAVTSPEAAAIGASTLATLPLDVAGGAVSKAAKALTAIPKVAEALDVARSVTAPVGNLLSRGYAIPSAMRNAVRDVLRASRGTGRQVKDFVETELDKAQGLILESATEKGVTGQEAEKFVRDLVETRHRDPSIVARASEKDMQAADILENLANTVPDLRVAIGLRPGKLGPPPMAGAPLDDQTLGDVVDLIRMAAKKRGQTEEQAFNFVRGLAIGKPGIVTKPLREERAAADMLNEMGTKIGDFRAAIEAAQKAVKYTPRYPRSALSEVLGRGGGRNITMKELMPRVPGPRGTPAELTTSELEKAIEAGAIRKTPVKQPIQPLLQAWSSHGTSTARSIANAKAINELGFRFGTSEAKAGAGWRSLGELDILKEYQPAVRKALSDRFVHPEVFRFMDDFTRATTPGHLPILGKFLSAWKPIVTTINPQFISRNMQWNAIIGWIRGNRNPANWTAAAGVMGREAPEAPVVGIARAGETARGARWITNAQLRQEALANNVVGSGTMAEFGVSGRRILAGAARFAPARVARVGTRINQMAEDLARLAFYIAKRRAGLSPVRAAKEVTLTFFDYSHDALSPFFNTLRRSYVPFVVWMRNIVPLTFRSLVENPSAFTAIGGIQAETAKAAGIKPTDISHMGPGFSDTMAAIYKGQKPGRFGAIPMSQLGYFDVARALHDPRAWAMAQLSPLIATPLEVAGVIKNAFTGKNAGDIVELPPVAGKFAEINPNVAAKLGIRYAAEGRAVGPQWLNTVLRTGGPLGTTVFDLWSSDPNARLRVFRWFTGISARENLNPQTGRKVEQIQAKVAHKAEKSRIRTGTRIIQQIRAGER